MLSSLFLNFIPPFSSLFFPFPFIYSLHSGFSSMELTTPYLHLIKFPSSIFFPSFISLSLSDTPQLYLLNATGMFLYFLYLFTPFIIVSLPSNVRSAQLQHQLFNGIRCVLLLIINFIHSYFSTFSYISLSLFTYSNFSFTFLNLIPYSYYPFALHIPFCFSFLTVSP